MGEASARIMVVEDELLIAMSLEETLSELGYEVVGPFPSLAAARGALDEPLSGCVLDVNVRGELIFPLAEALRARGVPVVLCTGYAETRLIPCAFDDVPKVAKPFTEAALRVALRRAIDGVEPPG